jgi:hypothetical protein
MLCNGNVPDANSPINFKNDCFCPASSRDFSILGNKSIMSLISIDSESHWKIPPLYVRDPQLWNIGERFF